MTLKNKNQPFISVVALNYNGLRFLKRIIPAILKLSYPNYEIIIVDNGSTDGSLEYIESFSQITLIKNGKNIGYSSGKNNGIKKAKGKYILLLDGDILISKPHALQALLYFYSRKSHIAFVSPLLFDENEEKTGRWGCYYSFYGQLIKKKLSKKEILHLPDFYKVAAPTGGAMFFEKNIWNELGGYDESFIFHSDDYDIGARSLIFGYDNYILNTISFLHIGEFRHENNTSWCWKYKYLLYGFSAIVIKNYKKPIKYLLAYHIFIWLKTIKQMFSRKSIYPFISFCISYSLFLKNLPHIIAKRKKIQTKRVVSTDTFLKIRPPKIT